MCKTVSAEAPHGCSCSYYSPFRKETFLDGGQFLTPGFLLLRTEEGEWNGVEGSDDDGFLEWQTHGERGGTRNTRNIYFLKTYSRTAIYERGNRGMSGMRRRARYEKPCCCKLATREEGEQTEPD